MAETAIGKPQRGWISIAHGKNWSETNSLQPGVGSDHIIHPEAVDLKCNEICSRRGYGKER
jgi:hypothetical protein